MELRERLALTALGVVVAVTATWWALALWPLPDEAPAWLVRTRAVCFGAAPRGLPDLAGWLALIGQPALMLGALRVVAGDAMGSGLRAMRGSLAGRVSLLACALVITTAIALAGWRVVSLGVAEAAPFDGADLSPGRHPRMDHPAPALGLVNQHGETVTPEMLRGGPALVTFAFAHCTTVCPVIVRDVLVAQNRLDGEAVSVVVVTLDPWRDTPARLPSIASRWELGPRAHLLSGSVVEIEEVLTRWRVPWSRDPLTGDVSHPVLVYVLDARGSVAFATSGAADTLVGLVRRLASPGPS